MVEAILQQAIAIGILCLVFVQSGDILEYFRPSPKLPKELNEFLATVQEHKDDFQLIRDAMQKNHPKNVKKDSDQDILGLKQTDGSFLERKYLQKRWSDDKPKNDIYPYMYSNKQTKNAVYGSNEKAVRIEPRGQIGNVERHAEKYPGRRFVDIKRESSDYSDEDYDDRDNIFGSNNIVENPGRTIKKREIEIEVKDDGKLVKTIREKDVSSKSIVLNIHPKSEKFSTPLTYNQNLEETKQDDPNKVIPLSDKLKDKEFRSNFENLFKENEHLNTDRSMTSEDVPANLHYQINYPNDEGNPVPFPAFPQNSLLDTRLNPPRKTEYINVGMQQNFEDTKKNQFQSFSTEYPIFSRKSSQSETESGFENVQSVVLDTSNDNLDETFDWMDNEKPEKRQLLEAGDNVDLNEGYNGALPAFNNYLNKNEFGRSISDYVLPPNDLEGNSERRYEYIEQSTIKIITESCEGGQAVLEDRQGTIFFNRNPPPNVVQENEPLKTGCVDSQGCNEGDKDKIKEIEKKIEEVDKKLETGSQGDLRNELTKEELKIQEYESKMNAMQNKIQCLETEIKRESTDSPKHHEVEELESKIDDEEDKIDEIEEKLDNIEESVEEVKPSDEENESQQGKLKEEIKKVQEAEEKIAEEAKKIEAQEKQLAETIEQKQQNLLPNKDVSTALTTSQNVPDIPTSKIAKEIKESDTILNPFDLVPSATDMIYENKPIQENVVEADKTCNEPKQIDTIEIIQDRSGKAEVKVYTEDVDGMKRTERALALIKPQSYAERIPVMDPNGKIRRIYVIDRNPDEEKLLKKRAKKKRKKKKKYRKHRPQFDEYISSDYINEFNEDDTNNNSDLIPAFKSRHLQAMYDAYLDAEDADEYEDDRDHQSFAAQMTKRTNSIEGDYGDDEEQDKAKNNKPEKIKKKSENEFADPVETTAFDEYYDEDYSNKKAVEHHKQPKLKIKSEPKPLHEIFEDTFGFDNLKSPRSHAIKRAHSAHGHKKKKIEPSSKPVEPERKIVKDNFKHLKKFKKVKKPKRNNHNAPVFSKKTAFNDYAEQLKLPKFVLEDRAQQENIRKRSLGNRRIKKFNQNKFPISTRNFFVKPEKKNAIRAEEFFKMAPKKHPWNLPNKRAEPFTPDPAVMGFSDSMPALKEAPVTAIADENFNRVVKGAPEATPSEISDVAVTVDACEDDNSTTAVVLETMLAIVPELDLDNNTLSSTNAFNNGNENSTQFYGGEESGTGMCVKTSRHTMLDDIMNGILPGKLVTDVKKKVQEIPNLSRRFEHGLLKHLKMSTSALNSNESTLEIEQLIVTMTKMMRKIVESASCQRLPHPLQDYVNYLTKNSKADVLSKPKEMEDIRFNDNANADSYLYDQSLHEKMNVMKDLLERYNKLPENCKVRAEPVKEYIESHLGMLSNMTSENSLHSAKRSYDANAVDLDERPYGDAVLYHAGRVNKRDVNHYSQSKQYQKLVDAVARMRHKRENERMIGELFGGGQRAETDDRGDFESPLVYSV